jgi:hypothetical protein
MTALQANKAPEAPALGMPVREKFPPSLGVVYQLLYQRLTRLHEAFGKETLT